MKAHLRLLAATLLCCLTLFGCMANPVEILSNPVDAVGPEKDPVSTIATPEPTEKLAKTSLPLTVDQISLDIVPIIFYGEKSMSLNYTNNSQYTIVAVEMKFHPKSNLTEEETKILSSLAEDVPSIVAYGYNEKIAKPGETSKNSPIYTKRGNHEVLPEHYALLEPYTISIAYVQDDDRIHGFEYEYSSGIVSEYANTSPAYDWPSSELFKQLPSIEGKIVRVESDYDQAASVTVFGCTETDFEMYVEKCKDLGFTIDSMNFDGHYDGSNENEDSLYVDFDENTEQLDILIQNYE